MSNLYSMTKGQAAVRELARAMVDLTSNLPTFSHLPKPASAGGARRRQRSARAAYDAVELSTAEYSRLEAAQPYLINARKTDRKYWLPYLTKPEYSCLVPVTSFAEPETTRAQNLSGPGRPG